MQYASFHVADTAGQKYIKILLQIVKTLHWTPEMGMWDGKVVSILGWIKLVLDYLNRLTICSAQKRTGRCTVLSELWRFPFDYFSISFLFYVWYAVATGTITLRHRVKNVHGFAAFYPYRGPDRQPIFSVSQWRWWLLALAISLEAPKHKAPYGKSFPSNPGTASLFATFASYSPKPQSRTFHLGMRFVVCCCWASAARY